MVANPFACFLPEFLIMKERNLFFWAITVWVLMWAAYNSCQSLIPPDIIAAFVISYVLDEYGLSKRICYWVVKTCGGAFKRTMAALYVSAGHRFGYI